MRATGLEIVRAVPRSLRALCMRASPTGRRLRRPVQHPHRPPVRRWFRRWLGRTLWWLYRRVSRKVGEVFHSVLLGITLGVAIYTYFFLAGLVNDGLDQQWNRVGLPTRLLRRILKQYRFTRAVIELLWDLYQGR